MKNAITVIKQSSLISYLQQITGKDKAPLIRGCCRQVAVLRSDPPMMIVVMVKMTIAMKDYHLNS